MRCPKCSAENSDGRKFCAQCGAPLRLRCATCGTENEPAARFCGECGTTLADVRPLHPPATASAARTDGERRHLTVLFSDLVNSTGLAARFDPEDWHDIAVAYQKTAAEAVTRLGGHVAQYLGDGLMVYFGWPTAHEDAAERAVRAGLAIIDAIGGLNDHLAIAHDVRLSVRVGIHTGSVVIGSAGGRTSDVFGDTPNIAARVQTAAAPDSVLMTGTVHALVAGLFVVEDCGAQTLKGLEQPIRIYRALQPTVVRRRRHRADTSGPTPFVGREDAMRRLLDCWEHTRRGEGQLALVLGEPGIGKSRLVEELRARLAGDPHLWIECAGERFFESTPFHVVTQMLDQGLPWHGDASDVERAARLERSLGDAGLDLAEAMPLVAELLHLPTPEGYPPLRLAPEQKRSRLLACLASWVLGAPRAHPTVIVIEDLHWVDSSTLELTQTVIEQAAHARLLLLCTARPEFRPPWPTYPHHTQITLHRLTDVDTRAMVDGMAASAVLDADALDAIVARTDGVPLFAEELTRLIAERAGRAMAREIPATLHDSLTARLDHLGRAKDIAQVAAVIGREFSYALLHAVASVPEAELHAGLDALARAEVIYTRGVPPDATYQFKHALIQDAAYEALLKSKRRELHRVVARVITERFAALAAAQPQTVARHWTEAGERELAFAAWKLAGDGAYARRAFKEAEGAFRQAQTLLASLPESPERDAREVELCSTFVQVLQLTRGYAAAETVELAARARALAEKVGDPAQLTLQDLRTWSAVFAAGNYRRAAELADRILQHAERNGYVAVRRFFAHSAQVQSRFYGGDLRGVEEHFAHLTDVLESAELGAAPGETVITIGAAGLCAWASGRSECARERVRRGLAFAESTQNPYDLALALLFEGYLYRFQREPRRAEAACARMLALSEEHGFSYGCDLARGVIGWARAHLGAPAQGVALVRRAHDAMVGAGTTVGITDVLTRLAEAQALDGAADQALRTIEEALAANPEEILFRPNSLTFRGRLRLAAGERDLAEQDFRAAITMAETMPARAWELRAATGLAEVLQERGERAAARALLAPRYDWFTEEPASPDVQDAKALLDRLGA